MASHPSADELLAELRLLADRLAALPETDPARAPLLRRRDRLRARARILAGAGRHPESLRRELETLRRRLAEIDGMLIDRSWPERRDVPWLNDPAAYSRTLNERLVRVHAPERERVVARIGELEELLGGRAQPPESAERNANP